MKLRNENTLLVCLSLGLGLVLPACADDTTDTGNETTGDGDGDGDGSGDGDGDGDGDGSGDGDGDGDGTGDGDGDGDGDGTGDGDGDGDGDGEPGCMHLWDADWQKDNGQEHAGYDVSIDADGNIFVTGRVEESDYELFVAMFTSDGETATKEWEEIVSNSGSDYGSAVQAVDGGVVVVGNLHGDNGNDIWIRRYDTSGNEDWTTTVPSETVDVDHVGNGAALTSDGNVVVSGRIRVGDSDDDIWVRKIDVSDGSEIWSSTWSGVADENGFSIDNSGPVTVDEDDNVYVVGRESVAYNIKEAVIVRFPADGGEADWAVTPTENGDEHTHEPTTIAAAPGGPVFAAVRQDVPVDQWWIFALDPSNGDVLAELNDEDPDLEAPPLGNWRVAELMPNGDDLTIAGRVQNSEPDEGISWTETWVADFDHDIVGHCMSLHNWENEHILPADNPIYGADIGPDGVVVTGEILDGPTNYFYLSGWE